MQRNARKKFPVSILTYLIPSLEKIAKRNKWELDDVVEEAFIHYLNSENIKIPYTGGMRKMTMKTALKKVEGTKADRMHDRALAKKFIKKPTKKK